MSVVLSYEGVTRTFDRNAPAVSKLDLQLKAGEILVLVGPSGSGKTTTLKMANALIYPTEGRVHVFHREIRAWNLEELRTSIGYVVQEIGLLPHMTVMENLGLLARLRGWDAPKIRARAEELLAFVGLNPAIVGDRFPSELSGGQAQRIGVARALMLSPRIILMDEPFGALDPITRRELQTEFMKIRRNIQASILMVTHDVAEAFRLGDRIAVMDSGKLIQVGSPDELRAAPRTSWVSEFVSA